MRCEVMLQSRARRIVVEIPDHQGRSSRVRMRGMKRWYPGVALFIAVGAGVGFGLPCLGCGSTAPAVTVPAPSPVVKAETTAQRPPAKPMGLEPPEPTLRLPRHFPPTGYAARLAIDPSQAGFEGAIQITGNVSEKSLVVWLNARKLM